jgi:aspartate carbamoyltransferase catalytic subunit
MPLQNVVSIADLSDAEIALLLDRAHALVGSPRLAPTGAACIQLLFYEDSTRTRTSFETAARRLGFDVCLVTASGSSVAKGENLRDTIVTLQESVDPAVIVVRHPENFAPRFVAEAPWSTTSVVNAGDGTNEHPTQALLDAFTLQRHFGTDRLQGLKVAIVGDIVRSRVARSNAMLLPRLGVDVTLVAPQLPADVSQWGVRVSGDLDAVVPDVDVVMALRIQRERMTSELDMDASDYHSSFGLTVARAEQMAPTAVVMHPGPMNRGVEIANEVADGPRSLITQQVRNGVWMRMAVLETLVNRTQQ